MKNKLTTYNLLNWEKTNIYITNTFIKRLGIFVSLVFLLYACENEHTKEIKNIPSGHWKISEGQRPASVLRKSGIVFQADANTTYFGLGNNPHAQGDSENLNDFYSYSNGVYIQHPDFPGQKRYGAVAFVIDNKAYVGLGRNTIQGEFFNDFWIYDIRKNSWEEQPLKYTFPGGSIAEAVSFSLNGKGYVGTGYIPGHGAINTFYEFDPSKGWKVIPFPGDKRYGGMACIIKGIAYVGLGKSDSGFLADLWKYTPSANSWEKVNTLPNTTDIARSGAISFVLSYKGEDYLYITGGNGDNYKSSTWGYNPNKNNWEEATSMPMNSEAGFGFASDEKNAIVRIGDQELIFSIED